MRIFENANYKFVDSRTKGYILSGILLVASIASIAIRGLELGIDFQGGMEFVVETATPLDATEVRVGLGGVLGFEPEVKTFDDALLVRTLPTESITAVQNQIVDGFSSLYPDSNPVIVKTDIVGPRFAEDLKRGAIYSILGSLLVIFVYILIRFEWRFGLGAVAALFHDVTITLGVFSALQGILPFSLQIDQTIIAAFLTIVGYSLNDTVVVFDRIREYSAIFKTEAYTSMVNKSINQTLSRTIVTSGTTLLVVAVLFIFGGEVLRGFAFALIIGILIGTYSSIFVASPVVVELRNRLGNTGR
ncbi:MAG: protein translocase subunit SecF [Rhodothermales bacterium]|nr:protein translocase subunit SecF [Rhodothermales bacterium]MBO6781283.1 protein translocase subunit SecF [Rhodothermales bacterium]